MNKLRRKMMIDQEGMRQRIVREADPMGLLIDICNGKRVMTGFSAGGRKRAFVYPSVEDRVNAAKVLLGKVVPDLKSIEGNIEASGDIHVTVRSYGRRAAEIEAHRIIDAPVLPLDQIGEIRGAPAIAEYSTEHSEASGISEETEGPENLSSLESKTLEEDKEGEVRVVPGVRRITPVEKKSREAGARRKPKES